MKKGDLVKVNGYNDDLKCEEEWYGEVVEVYDDKIDVYFLEKTNKCGGFIWSYSDTWHTIEKDTVKEVIHPEAGAYVKAYEQLGFGPTEVENEFVFLEDEEQIPLNFSIPLRLDMKVTNNDMYVDDGCTTLDESEAFTLASDDSQFVNDMHKAVEDYNSWNPTDASELKAKEFLDNIVMKVIANEDDKQFANGTSVNYNHPTR